MIKKEKLNNNNPEWKLVWLVKFNLENICIIDLKDHQIYGDFV